MDVLSKLGLLLEKIGLPQKENNKKDSCLRQVIEELTKRNNVIIYGGRQTGKTHMAMELLKELAQKNNPGLLFAPNRCSMDLMRRRIMEYGVYAKVININNVSGHGECIRGFRPPITIVDCDIISSQEYKNLTHLFHPIVFILDEQFIDQMPFLKGRPNVYLGCGQDESRSLIILNETIHTLDSKGYFVHAHTPAGALMFDECVRSLVSIPAGYRCSKVGSTKEIRIAPKNTGLVSFADETKSRLIDILNLYYWAATLPEVNHNDEEFFK